MCVCVCVCVCKEKTHIKLAFEKLKFIKRREADCLSLQKDETGEIMPLKLREGKLPFFDDF